MQNKIFSIFDFRIKPNDIFRLSIIHYLLSIIHYLLSIIHYPLSINKWKYLVIGLGFLLMDSHNLLAQTKQDSQLVQLSGLVLDGTTDELLPIPYTNVYIKDESQRGDYTDFKGYFTIVARKGETVVFSTIGYKTIEYVVPDSLEDNRYSIVQLMTQDTFNLPETVVFPWPSKEHFKIEFLAMDVTPELQRRASENVAEEMLARGRKTVYRDGNENADYYLRQQASSYYYYGQIPPMNIFSPIAWGKFIKSWKNGDFKKKKK